MGHRTRIKTVKLGFTRCWKLMVHHDMGAFGEKSKHRFLSYRNKERQERRENQNNGPYQNNKATTGRRVRTYNYQMGCASLLVDREMHQAGKYHEQPERKEFQLPHCIVQDMCTAT